MALAWLMLSFWKGPPHSLEPTQNSSEEFETYTKAILYRKIVFTIVDLLSCVIIIVLLRFKFTHSNAKVLTVFCTLTVFRTLMAFRIFPEDFTLSFEALKVAIQILGRKFYKNTEKSSLYSQTLLIFIHKTPVVESHPITRESRELLRPRSTTTGNTIYFYKSSSLIYVLKIHRRSFKHSIR